MLTPAVVTYPPKEIVWKTASEWDELFRSVVDNPNTIPCHAMTPGHEHGREFIDDPSWDESSIQWGVVFGIAPIRCVILKDDAGNASQLEGAPHGGSPQYSPGNKASLHDGMSGE